MAQLFDSMDWVDKEDDLTTALGTDNPQTTTEVVAQVAQSAEPQPLPIRVIRGKKYLIVDQSANRRAGSKASVIW